LFFWTHFGWEVLGLDMGLKLFELPFKGIYWYTH
jgi:hypothetical protein